MLQVEVWVFVLSLIGVLIVGGVIGFFLARYLIMKQIEKNPTVTEKQIRAMYEQMGRKPSEKQIRAIMRSANKK
ncbi:MAG: YneF family protein [Candidatus Enteromonas sp.]|nr:YneF family protein [Candidatus Enteromonas sp.]